MSLSCQICSEKRKRVIIGILLLLVLGSIFQAPISTSTESQASIEDSFRILFVMDENYGGNCEYILEIFQEYGWAITTTAISKTILGCEYVAFAPFEVDLTLSELESIFLYDCISFMPGDSHVNLLDNPEIHKLIQDAVSKNIVVTAWCRAVRILARAGVLGGRNITGHHDYQAEYEAAGATFNYQAPPIADGNIITSSRSRFYRNEICELIKATVENNAPELIDFSSYLGGTGDEEGIAAGLNYLGGTVVDSQGNIIIAGRTDSDDFPVKAAFQDHSPGGIDITLSKFYPNGSLIFSTYFGGSADEWATCVAVDSQDNIIFAGITGSSDFPLMNPLQADLMGGTESNADCFIAKLSEDGQSLLYSTFFGGTGSDWCYAMAVDANDRIAITGTTYSNNFPLFNPHQSTNKGSLECFVSLLEADGQSVVFSTYLGSNKIDSGRGMDFDSIGNLLVTGQAGSGALGTEGVFQQEYGGGTGDAYLAKFKPNGTLDYFSFLGGSGFDRANDLAVDSEDNVIITGYTYSGNFPILNAYQEEQELSGELFITKFDHSGQSIAFSTYLGGSSLDYGNALTIDSEDNVVVTGQTDSSDFPRTNTTNPVPGDDNVLLAKLKKDGSSLLFSTLFGGAAEDVGVGVAWYSNNSYIIVGFTKSTDFPIYRAYQPDYGGNCDLFIMKVRMKDISDAPVSSDVPTSSDTPDSQPAIGISIGESFIVSIAVTFFLLRVRKKAKRS